MRPAHIGDNRLVNLVATNAHRMGEYDIAKRKDGHLCRTAANIHNHRARRFGHRQRGPDGCRHGLFNQKDAAGTCRLGRFLNGTTLNSG